MKTKRFWIVFHAIKAKHPDWSNKRIAIITRCALAQSDKNYDKEYIETPMRPEE